MVNHLSKPPLSTDKYYYREDSYAVNNHTGDFRPNAQGSYQENRRQSHGNKGQNYGNYNREDHYIQYGNYNSDNNFNRGNNGNKNDTSRTSIQGQICEVAPPWWRQYGKS